ncbi:hypothetical protein LTS18_009701, partial [Coniosporium uncinatum]
MKAFRDSIQDSNFRFKVPSMSGFGSSITDLNGYKRASTSLRELLDPRSMTSQRDINKSIEAPTEPKMDAANRPRASVADNGAASAAAASHPYFTKALAELKGDIVVLGGYRGSVLREAHPPHRRLWVPFKVGLNLRKVDLEVGWDPEDEEHMEEKIVPDGMLSHIGPVEISRRLLKRLRACENAQNGKLRVHEWGYDWRLSPHLLSRKMKAFLEQLPCNKPGVPVEKSGAIVVAHSLGGLITRHAVNDRPELFAGVVYAGVPQHCVNILGPLRNGDDVLLSSRVLTAQVNFSIRTSFALLPLEGRCFLNKHTKEQYPVDFFSAETWIDYALSPCVARPLPTTTQPQRSGVGGIVSSMASVLPIIGRRGSQSRSDNASSAIAAAGSSAKEAAGATAGTAESGAATNTGLAPQMGSNAQSNSQKHDPTSNISVGTMVTVPREKAIQYLTRTLAEVKRFKEELAFKPELAGANRYPPVAVIYGKSEPTVYGAKVEGREGIKRSSAYDELAFASGDGVVLARAAMVPEGYSVVKGGI